MSRAEMLVFEGRLFKNKSGNHQKIKRIILTEIIGGKKYTFKQNPLLLLLSDGKTDQTEHFLIRVMCLPVV